MSEQPKYELWCSIGSNGRENCHLLLAGSSLAEAAKQLGLKQVPLTAAIEEAITLILRKSGE